MSKTYDLIIVGAGIIGLSIAWQIARRSRLKVAVVEKGAGVGEGSTGASSAVCRFRYSLDEVVHLARDGVSAYRHWQQYTGLADPRASFANEGVLWMPGTDREWAGVEAARLRDFDIDAQALDVADVNKRFPAINTCCLAADVETGEDHECIDDGRFLYEAEGGYMDPVSTAQDLVDACRGRGVDILFNTPVAGIEQAGGSVTAVALACGETLSTSMIINATGPWCRDLYAAAGLELNWNLKPVRIQVLHRDRPDSLHGHIPITVDMLGGVYFRTQNQGQQIIAGSVLEEDEREVVDDPDNFCQTTDTEFELRKLHALHHRLPGLPYTGKVTGYCGLYTFNLDDVHPVLGPTAVDGFWVANGFSGHGFKLAPAIGSMVAKAVTGERAEFDTSVPLSFLAFDREPFQIESKTVLA